MQDEPTSPPPAYAPPWGEAADMLPREDDNRGLGLGIAFFIFIGLLQGLFLGWLIWG